MKKYRIAWGVWLAAMILNYLFSQNYAGLYLLVGSLALPILSVVYTLLIGRKLSLDVQLPKGCRKKERVKGVLLLSSPVGLPIFKIQVNLNMKNLFTAEELRRTFETCLIGKKGEALSFYLENALCGCVQIQVESAAIYDLFGIWKRPLKISADATINVIPETFYLDLHIAPGLLVNNDSIEYSREKMGSDVSEIFGIREYRPGDNIKNIHWKLTSKCDDIMVKQPSLPLENSILLLLETSIDSEDEKRAEIFDALAEIYITISQTLIDNKISHQIAWYDQHNQTFFTYDIEEEGDIHSVIGRILSAEHKLDKMHALEHYTQERGIIDKAHLIYVSPEYTGNMQELSQEIRKTMILCRDKDTGEDDAELSLLSCTPENYIQELQGISV